MSSLVSRVATGQAPLAPPVDTRSARDWLGNHSLLLAIMTLGLFGTVMIASASMAIAEEMMGSPFHFVSRQMFFLSIGAFIGVLVFRLPLAVWEKYGPHLIILSMFFLVLVLVPGIGKEVNGSRRWIDLGLFTVQVSETVKLFIIVYLSGYLVRRGYLVQNTFGGFLRPLILITAASALLLLEPDFGAAVIIVCTAMIMLFVAGVRFLQFAALLGALGSLGALLIVLSPYRMRRFASFLDPFSDPWDAGFQLTQSLIAIGSGGLTGVGLGNSVQKLFYLPEAHTDFLFAVLCEELGLIGALMLVALYAFIVFRCFCLASLADRLGHRFASFIALGMGVWIGLQSFVNMGVNMGVLPTKGITLPLMSYGGSSAIVFAIAFSLLLRVEWELAQTIKARQIDASIDPFNSRSTGGFSEASNSDSKSGSMREVDE